MFPTLELRASVDFIQNVRNSTWSRSCLTSVSQVRNPHARDRPTMVGQQHPFARQSCDL